MSKNKKQMAQRKAAKAEKQRKNRKVRVAQYREVQVQKLAHAKKVAKAAHLMRDGVPVPDITDEEYVFWLCHGANFIVSNEEDGTWAPMFEGIYEGRLPEAEAVAQTVLSRYAEAIESEETLTGVPRSVLAWTVTEKPAVRIYKYESERRMQKANPDLTTEQVTERARQPHNPTVWGVMAEVKKRTLAAG